MRYSWIVIHDGSRPGKTAGQQECLRCGESYRMALPVSLNVFIAAGKAFTADHRGCKATPPPRAPEAPRP